MKSRDIAKGLCIPIDFSVRILHELLCQLCGRTHPSGMKRNNNNNDKDSNSSKWWYLVV